MHRDYRFSLLSLLAMLVICVGSASAQSGVADIELLDPPYNYLEPRETHDSARVPLYLFLSRVEQSRPSAEAGLTHENLAAQFMVQQFIAGVVDAGEDISWCVRRSGIPPYEIDEAIISMLMGVQAHDEALKMRGAAKIIARYLERTYPCDSRASR